MQLKATLAFILMFVLFLTANAQAFVVLPESSRLAGPLNSAASEFGNEFLFFPDFLGDPGIPARTPQNGWVEIQFGPPDGNLVEFAVTFRSVGPDSETEFSEGQLYRFRDETLLPLGGGGVLDLDTGVVEEILIGAAFENSVISEFGKLNRIRGTFGHVYPPDLTGLPLPPLPPGFVFAQASFMYAPDGSIVGFDFAGQSLAPVGAFSFSPNLPEYAFGPQGQVYFPNPSECSDITPPEACPDDMTLPTGLTLPFQAILHPFTFLRSDEMREVPVVADVPVCAPDGRAGSVAVTAGGLLYQIGGTSLGQDLGRVDIYDPASGSWEEGERMAVPVGEAQGAAIDGKIYVVGGRRAPRGPANAILQVFDIGSGEWEQLTAAPWPVASAAAVANGGRLYVIGGLTNRPNGSPSGNLRFADAVQIYDPASDTWQAFEAAVDGERLWLSDASAVTSGTSIYVLGGRTLENEVTSQTLVYDVLNDTFAQGPPSLWPVYDAAAALIGDRIYLAGGRSVDGGPIEARMQTFETAQNAWIRAVGQPLATTSSGATELDGRLYVLGGRSLGRIGDFSGQDTNALQYFDPARGWRACNTQPLFAADHVLSTASLVVGPTEFSPGAQASLLGLNLAGASASAPAGEDVPTELAGVSLTVDGEDAPILGVSRTRIDFQVPYGVRINRNVKVELTSDGAAAQAPPVEVQTVAAVPNIFVQSCGKFTDPFQLDGAYALACHADGTLNYTANTVAPGEVLRLQMSGLGAVSPELGNGERAPGDGVEAVALPTVRVEGADGSMIEADVLSATLAPGEVGIYDVEVVIPAGARINDRVKIDAMIGDLTSNLATISIGDRVADEPVPCLRETNPLVRFCAPLPTGP